MTPRSMCLHGQQWWVGSAVHRESVSSERSNPLQDSIGLILQGELPATLTIDSTDR